MSVKSLVLAQVVLASQAAFATPWAGVAPSLRYVNLLDVYVAGDLYGVCTDIEGRFGAGRDIYMQRFGANGLAKSDLVFTAAFGAAESAEGHSVFAGRNVSLLNGSVAGGYRGIQANGVVALDQFSVGNVRGSVLDFSAEGGSVYGAVVQGGATLPHATYQAALKDVATRLGQMTAGALAPEVAGETLTFKASASGTAVYRVPATKVGSTWIFDTSFVSRIVVEIEGLAVDLDGVTMIGADSQWVAIVAPQATSLHLGGRSVDERKDYYATIFAPQAAVTFNFGRLWGGLYAASLTAAPVALPWTRFADCATTDGSPSATSGGQVNHRPFADSFADEAGN